MPVKTLSVAKDFSEVPGARLRRDGPNSAEEFRTAVLVPALRSAIDGDAVLEVVLDGTAGYEIKHDGFRTRPRLRRFKGGRSHVRNAL
jgi:hypothetical protein